MVHAGGANVVHDLDHRAELCSRIGLDKHRLVRLVGEPIFDFLRSGPRAESDRYRRKLAFAGDRDQQRIFLVGIRHGRRIVHLRHVDGWPCCNMGVTTMKMISSTNITSTMGVTLMSELTFAPSFRTADCHGSSFPRIAAALNRSPWCGGAGAGLLGAPVQQLMLATAVSAA